MSPKLNCVPFWQGKIARTITVVGLVVGLICFSRARVEAQTFKVLHSFSGLTLLDNSDGVQPQGALMVLSNELYGVALQGGASGNGTIFRLNADGTGFTNLHSLNGTEGRGPEGGLVLSSNTFFCANHNGGVVGFGTVLRLNLDGTGATNIFSFTGGTNGDETLGKLIMGSNRLYGTLSAGGTSPWGTVFVVNADGSGFSNLYNFTGVLSGGPGSNSDGALPAAGLVLSGNTLYGTAKQGGTSGKGTIFAVNTDGSSFTNLHSFSKLVNNSNADGAAPVGALLLVGNTLYGTASAGGLFASGTIFAINTDGSGFTNLYSFSATNVVVTNADGAKPSAELIISGNTLYGTASGGGTAGTGTVFAINTDGSSFTNLHNFSTANTSSTNADGAGPAGGLFLWGNTLYGTATRGGNAAEGTIFSILIGPMLNLNVAGGNLVLTWPTNLTGFNLQSTTDLNSPVWTNVFTSPLPANGQFTVTNDFSAGQIFYRLSQ